MSTNCLVTKLKGSVNNENLPMYGKIVIDMRTAYQSQAFARFGFSTGSDGNVKSKVTLANGVTFINEGSPITGTAELRTGVGVINADTAINKAITLDNVYNLKTLWITGGEFAAINTTYGNLSALQASENLKLLVMRYTSLSDVVIPKNCKAFGFAVEGTSPNDFTEQLNNLDGAENLKYIAGVNNLIGSSKLNINNLANNIKPQTLVNLILEGDISNLPNSVEFITVNRVSTLSGSVEDFVTSTGKSAGQLYIVCGSGTYTSLITFENSPIVENPNREIILKFSWQNNTITKETVSQATLNGITLYSSDLQNAYMAARAACRQYIYSLDEL